MASPFENPKEVNPFQTVVKPVFIPTPAIEVVVVEKERIKRQSSIEFPFFIRHSNKKNRLLRISCRNW